MQRFSSSNMSYDESGYFECPEAFGMDTDGNESTNMSTSLLGNFTGTQLDKLDPSASFPGLGELPSQGMEGVDHNLSGTLASELNSSSVGFEVDDHSQLLQEMLQQQSQPQPGQTPQSQQAAASAWEESLHALQEMLLLQQHQQQAQQLYQSQAEQVFNHPFSQDRAGNITQTAGFNAGKFPGESELLSLLQLPRCAASSLPAANSGAPGYISNSRGKNPMYSTSTISGPVNTGDFYDGRNHHLPMHSQQLHNSPHSATSFFHNLPRGDTYGPPPNSAQLTRPAPIFVDLEQEKDEDGKTSTSLGSKRENSIGGKGEPRGVNHFATERQRREFLNEKYQTLRSLVPNPSKADRASIVADAIDYVKELKRTVQELQLLVQEKRRTAGGGLGKKRRRTLEADGNPASIDMAESASTNQSVLQKGNDAFSADGSQLRSSWLQRTSQSGTQVDVRIVHDEVTIKLSQRRRRNCLMDVMSVLQELQLDLLHASGASIGEHDVYLFNTKILEGSSTFAGYIAAKLLDAVDHRT